MYMYMLVRECAKVKLARTATINTEKEEKALLSDNRSIYVGDWRQEGDEFLHPINFGRCHFAVADNPLMDTYEGNWLDGKPDGHGGILIRGSNEMVPCVWVKGKLEFLSLQL